MNQRASNGRWTIGDGLHARSLLVGWCVLRCSSNGGGSACGWGMGRAIHIRRIHHERSLLMGLAPAPSASGPPNAARRRQRRRFRCNPPVWVLRAGSERGCGEGFRTTHPITCRAPSLITAPTHHPYRLARGRCCNLVGPLYVTGGVRGVIGVSERDCFIGRGSIHTYIHEALNDRILWSGGMSIREGGQKEGRAARARARAAWRGIMQEGGTLWPKKGGGAILWRSEEALRH